VHAGQGNQWNDWQQLQKLRYLIPDDDFSEDIKGQIYALNNRANAVRGFFCVGQVIDDKS
jgi:hypothetical protein